VTLERYGATPTLTIRPSDKTKIVLSAEYFMDKRIGDRGMPSRQNGASNLGNRPYDIGDHSTFYGNARLSPNQTETKAFNATIEHAFDNGMSIRNITRYADYDKYYDNVYASSSVNSAGQLSLGAYLDDTQRQNLFNQTDLNYTLKAGGLEHKLMAGMELARQKNENSRTSLGGSGDSLISGVDVNSPYFNNERSWFNRRINRRSDVNIMAFYLQDQIVINPQWELVLGLRHDRFDVDYTDLPTTNNLTRNDKRNVTDHKISPRAGLIFKPLENLSLYASYSQSFVPRAGDQFNMGGSLAQVNLSPEKFINHEVGAKFDVSPELSLTAAVYKLQRENMAVPDPNIQETIIIDGQETKGLELGVSGKVSSKWSMFGGYALQDAKITDDYDRGDNRVSAGAQSAQTPRQTFSLWNRYQFNEVWGAAIGVISRSEMFAAIPTATTSTILPGYTRIDAAIYGQFTKNLRLQVNLENLTNKEYALSAHNNNNILPGSPLAGRATLIYNF
jgi:catecholate siderophore receptor